MRIQFSYNGNKYFIEDWYREVKLMTIRKDTGSIARCIRYADSMKIKDFLQKLEKINFL